MSALPRVWLLGVALGAACHGGPRAALPELRDTDRGIAEAMASFRRGDFSQAAVAFRRLQFELSPTQPEKAIVDYFLAECAFQTGDKETAARDFQKVAEEYPASPYAPVALLRAGDSHLRRWRAPELDAEAGQSALAVYQALQGRYPGTAAAERAQQHIAQLNDWFAEKAYRNGMFYLRRRAFDSAIIYFKDIIASYPNTRLVADALLRLVDSYRAIGYTVELKEACANLREYHPKTHGIDRHCPPP